MKKRNSHISSRSILVLFPWRNCYVKELIILEKSAHQFWPIRIYPQRILPRTSRAQVIEALRHKSHISHVIDDFYKNVNILSWHQFVILEIFSIMQACFDTCEESSSS